MKKRFISGLLCLILVLSLLPTVALAAPKITSVKALHYTKPVTGQSVDENLLKLTIPDDVHYHIAKKDWWDTTDGWFASDYFLDGHEYMCRIFLEPDEGYEFAAAEDMTAAMDGMSLTVYNVGNEPTWRAFSMDYVLPDMGVISVTGMVQPVAGLTAGECLKDLRLVGNPACKILSANWIKELGGVVVKNNETFVAGQLYYLEILLQPLGAAQFANKVTVKLNGIEDLVDPVATCKTSDDNFLISSCSVKALKENKEYYDFFVEDLADPVEGMVPDIEVTLTNGTDNLDLGCYVQYVSWFEPTYSFEAGKVYEVEVCLKPWAGCAFAKGGMAVKINGKSVLCKMNDDGSMSLFYTYPKVRTTGDCHNKTDICGSAQFYDAPAYTDWAHAGIDFAVGRGLFNGTYLDTFSPKDTMTRAMLVTVLWRYEGAPKNYVNHFTDVADGMWYTDAVAWASAKGIVNGMGDGLFVPDAIITREQMAAILYRYSVDQGIDPNKWMVALNPFPDVGEISLWAQEPMSWAVGAGLINGVSMEDDIYLQPVSGATREQVASILMRFIKNVMEVPK